ncbi:MAG: class I SAM-dependent methyltransferase [Candidatus Odinarchaeota archaeon]
MKYSNELVLRVNEVYHDIIGEINDKKYLQSHIEEFHRWENFGKKYLGTNNKKIKILDVGTGTGFIPSVIGKYLKEEDLFICSDISSKMLEICRKKLSSKNVNFILKILKVNGNKFDLGSRLLDFITMNSVLHHLPQFSVFFSEVDRMLKVGGRIVIGHEPNKYFIKSKILFNNFRVVNLIFDKKRIIPTFLRKIKFQKLSKRIEYIFQQRTNIRFVNTYNKAKDLIKGEEVVKKINECIMNLKLIEKPLSPVEISCLIDFHSPTIIAYRYDKGINIYDDVKNYLPNFEIEYFETYYHLGRATNINKFTKAYDLILRKIFPKKGAAFFMILKKNQEIPK